MVRLAALIFILVGTVLAGVGVTAIVSVPALLERASLLIPVAAVASYVVAIPISWVLARSIAAQAARPHTSVS